VLHHTAVFDGGSEILRLTEILTRGVLEEINRRS